MTTASIGAQNGLIVDSAAVTLVPVREPLVLISQVQRSGGTLLSQLFDGHPEVHAHPGELHIGPGKSHWPALDPDETPEAWFDALFERITLEFVETGLLEDDAGRPQRRHLRRVPVPLRPRAPARDLPGGAREPGSLGARSSTRT